MRIAVLDDYQGAALLSADWSAVKAAADVVVFRDTLADEEAIAGRLKDFEIVCLMRERTPFPERLIAHLPKLRLIVTTGMRNAAIDVAVANARGIVVSGTAGSGASTVELTWALILALARNVTREHAAMRHGAWQSTLGSDLAGRTLSLLGLGRIGAAVARIGLAFGMQVLAWSQNLTPERAEEVGAKRVTREAAFAEADVLSVHLVLSQRSRGLIDAAMLGRMQPGALLINTSRGPIVDEAALLAALRSGRLGGAGLDVYDQEPLPADHPLRRLDNVVLTPHLGYVTRQNYAVFYRETVENILAFLAGRPIRVLA
ncbi:MAG: D-2-hydroxyacid dehydrogenase family protein [Alphaproteobacteria bacterium]|nr:D-2-hydroxyacid dehydrogenase family protein [Alphaproteobacteria bacterium]